MSDVVTAEAPPTMQALAQMTPVERYNIAARAHGAPTVERPVSRAQFHTDATVSELARRDGAAAAVAKPREDGSVAPPHAGRTPPTPAELAAGNSKLEAFDAELRAKGMQITPPPDSGRFQVDDRTGITVDTAAVQRCHELFRALPAAERDAARAEYEETLAGIYGGKLQLSDMEGSTAPEQPRDAQGRFAPPQEPKPAAPGWQSHIEDGAWVDIGKLTLNDTSGYKIPRYVNDQRLNTSTFELLRAAKAAGISQAQVNAVFHGQAVAAGWVKA